MVLSTLKSSLVRLLWEGAHAVDTAVSCSNGIGACRVRPLGYRMVHAATAELQYLYYSRQSAAGIQDTLGVIAACGWQRVADLHRGISSPEPDALTFFDEAPAFLGAPKVRRPRGVQSPAIHDQGSDMFWDRCKSQRAGCDTELRLIRLKQQVCLCKQVNMLQFVTGRLYMHAVQPRLHNSTRMHWQLPWN